MSERTAVAPRVEAAKPTREAKILGHLAPLMGGDEAKARKMYRVALNAMSKTPALARCNEGKFWLAVSEVAAMNLTIGVRGAYLVPYKTEVQVIISPHGLVELAFRHPLVRSVQARVVRAGEAFRVEYAPDAVVQHEPRLSGSPGDLVGCYAIIDLATGGRVVEYMTRDEVLAIRQRSQSARKGEGPWITDEAEMWRKTVLKRAMKYVPQSEEMMRALEIDDDDTDLSVVPDHARSLVAAPVEDAVGAVVVGAGVAGLKVAMAARRQQAEPEVAAEPEGTHSTEQYPEDYSLEPDGTEADDPWGAAVDGR
jgi:recombination protein RecT